MCSCGTTDLDCFSVLIHCCKLYVHHRSAGCVTSIWFPEVSFSDQQVRVSCGKSGCFGPRCQQLCCLPSGLEGSRSDCSPLGVSDLKSSAAGPFPPTPPWPGSNFVKYTTAPLSLCDRINCLQWKSLCRVTPDRRESSKSLITTLFLFPSAAESQKWPLEEKKQVLVSGRTEIILTIAAFSVFTGVSALSFHSSTSKRICESHWRPHKNSVWFQDNASLRVNSVFI